MADTFIYRIDHHGSLVRPHELLSAREYRADGDLDDEDLRAIEDDAVAGAVRAQRRKRMTIVTDGHFRRAEPFDVYRYAIPALREVGSDIDAARLADAIAPTASLAVEDTVALAELTEIAAKATLPAPSAVVEELLARGDTSGARDLGEALAELVERELRALFGSGVSYVQLDAHSYTRHLRQGAGPPTVLSLEDSLAIDALAVADVVRPEGAVVGVCPLVEVSDDLDLHVADRLFAGIPVERWNLPFHSGHPNERELVRRAPESSDVCLGVVDAGTPELEDLDALLDRMDALEEFRDWERIAVSPNRGFADVAGKPLIEEDEQWAKLTHVETVARMAWGNEL